ATARVWDARTGQPAGPPLRHGAAVRQAAFSPDGRRVLTAGDDGSVRVWETATGEAAGQPLRHGGAPSPAAVRPDGPHAPPARAACGRRPAATRPFLLCGKMARSRRRLSARTARES